MPIPSRYYEEKVMMPELPECETIHRQLQEQLTDLPFGGVAILKPEWLLSCDYYSMGGNFEPTILKRIQRKGKGFCWYTASLKIYLHLRMSGQFRIVRSLGNSVGELQSMFDHVKAIFTFYHRHDSDKSFRLIFTDTRGFGVCEVTPNYETIAGLEHPKFGLIGVDPTYPGWSLGVLEDRLANEHANAKIGSVLLDQACVAGIGNIYRSEIMHASSILPTRKIASLDAVDTQRIFDSTNSILAAAIKARGCSMNGHQSTYVDLYGQKGDYASQLHVYQRSGELCLSCESGIIFQAELEKNRRVYWCPDCQR